MRAHDHERPRFQRAAELGLSTTGNPAAPRRTLTSNRSLTGTPMNEASTQIDCYQHHRSRAEVVDMYWTGDRCSLFMPLAVGAARVTRGGAKLFEGALRPGMLRLTVPEERSQVVFQAPTRLVELVITGDTLRRAFQDAGYLWPRDRVTFHPLVRPSGMIATLAGALSSAQNLHPPYRQDYLAGLTQALLACLVDSRHFDLKVNERAPVRSLSDTDFARCRGFAEANLGKRLNLQQWAAALDMGPGEFARAFRKRTKQSPYAWFLNRRIEHAKLLLQNRALPLADIALRAGFCSQSHFTEAFRRRVGCSPARWVLSVAGDAVNVTARVRS